MRAALEIVGIGPPMVDIQAVLRADQKQIVQETFGIGPGDRAVIDDHDEIDEILRLLIGGESRPGRKLEEAVKGSHVALYAGSTILNSLNAMQVGYGQPGLAMVTARPQRYGADDPLFQFFNRQAAARNIEHRHSPVHGYNPVSFLFSSEDNVEKMAIGYIGASADLSNFEIDPKKTKVLIVDAYELAGGKISKFIDSLIDSGSYKIALSLGSREILTDSLSRKIRSYIANGKIMFLGGNESEYAALLGADYAEHQGPAVQPFIKNNVPYALVTFGKKGMAAVYDGKEVFQEATVQPGSGTDKGISTSGAGDVSFGIFIAGIARGEEPSDSLLKASQWSSKVIQLPSGLINISGPQGHRS